MCDNKKYKQKDKLKFYNKLRKSLSPQKDLKITQKTKLTDYLFLLPDLFVLFNRLIFDKRVSKANKIFIAGVLTYIIFPFDFITDFFTLFGLVDDLLVCIYSLNKILNDTPLEVIKDNWNGSEDMLKNLQVILKETEKYLDKKLIYKIKKYIFK